MSYKIGSFNMYNLNFRDNKEIKRSFEMIAEIIKREKFDIIAMQEVLSDNVWNDKLKHYFNTSFWKFKWEQPRQFVGNLQADQRGEGYAYLWNSKRLDLVTTETPQGLRVAYPRIWKQYVKNGQKLIREPYYARFTPRDLPGGSFFEIRLISTHIVFGDKIDERKQEFKKLASSIYPNIADRRYGNNMPAYTVVLGDYNLCTDKIEKIIVGDGREHRTIITLQDKPTTLNRKEKEDGTHTSDGYSNNDYDHFSVDDRVMSSVKIQTDRVDAVNKHYDGDFGRYKKEISDHVPVAMNINLKWRNK